MSRRAVLAAALVLLLPGTALAGQKGDMAGAFLFGPGMLALLLFPTGLAVHWLLLGFSPRRGLTLVDRLAVHRGKTIVLGVVNTVFILFFAGATGGPAPLLSVLAITFWLVLALIGSHGIARSIGARVLGREEVSGSPDDLKELAVGWFVMVFTAGFPFLGLLAALYWSVRATGGVILTLLAADEDGEAPATPPPDKATDGLAPV